jgi:hypothetical protein
MTTMTTKRKGQDSKERRDDVMRWEGTNGDDNDEGEGTGQRRERG